MNLSFAGCGFLGIYHVGVAACFRTHLPDLCLNKISGASAGAIAAACLLCDAPLGEITSLVLEIATQARRKVCGPFNPFFDIQTLLRNGLRKVLPDDAHLRVNGRINISVTTAYTGKNVILSEFASKEELIQAILCSAFIPVFSGILPPKFRGVRYMDGGFTKNILIVDDNTVTVSPFCGNSDVCPMDMLDPMKSIMQFEVSFANTSIELSMENLLRLFHIVFPPDAETMTKICQQGFDDAKRFLERNRLIGCEPCVISRWTRTPLSKDFDGCLDCEKQKQEVSITRLPVPIASTLQTAVDETNSALLSRVMKHPAVRVISLLSTPYILPADLFYSMILRICQWLWESGKHRQLLSLSSDTQVVSLTSDKSRKMIKVEKQRMRNLVMSFGVNLHFEETRYEVCSTSYGKDSLDEVIAHNDYYEELVLFCHGQVKFQAKYL